MWVIQLRYAQRLAVELVLARVHKFGFVFWTCAVTKRGPPGRLCLFRFSIQQRSNEDTMHPTSWPMAKVCPRACLHGASQLDPALWVVMPAKWGRMRRFGLIFEPARLWSGGRFQPRVGRIYCFVCFFIIHTDGIVSIIEIIAPIIIWNIRIK